MVSQGLALSGDTYQLTQGKKLAEKHGLFVAARDERSTDPANRLRQKQVKKNMKCGYIRGEKSRPDL
jgi:hypothetical protein